MALPESFGSLFDLSRSAMPDLPALSGVTAAQEYTPPCDFNTLEYTQNE
jgi:hypothetical protein